MAAYDETLMQPQQYIIGPVRNYADTARVKDRLKNELLPMLDIIRERRKPLTRMWHSMHKVWTMEHEQQAYYGDTNVYVPAGHKGAETIVAQLVSATFPSDDSFGVDARRKEDVQTAMAKKEIAKYQLHKQAKARTSAERFYRQLVITGNSPFKVFWDKRIINGQRRRGPYAIPRQNEIVMYNGPVLQPVDITNLYYWPENVNDPADTELVFEDIQVPINKLWQRVREGLYSESAMRSVGEKAKNADVDENNQAKLSAQGIPGMDEVTTPGWSICNVTECYFYFDPAAETRNDERYPVPFKVVVANGEILQAIRNPWWHQRPPYLLGRMGTMVGRLYGTGYMEVIRDLNLLLNDQANHGMDAIKYALNPIFLTNPNVILGNMPDIEPGAQVLTLDINQAMRVITPPMDVINAMPIITGNTIAWIQDFMNAPPVLQGGSAPGRAFRTATGVGTAQRNATMPLQEVIRLCEVEVWEQVLFMFDYLTEQFADDEYIINASGQDQPILRIDPRTLAADVYWKWLASTQTDNKMVKGQEYIQLLGLLAQMSQPLAQAGYLFNPYPLVRRLMTEVMGVREVDEVVVKQAVQSMGQPGMGAAPVTPEVGAGVPPEAFNEEMGATRIDANQLAAMMGMMNMPGTGELTEDEMM